MVSKDQSIGGAIFLVCLIVAIFYVVTLFYPTWLSSALGLPDTFGVQFWIIAIPVFVAFVAIMAIGAWIGWTMATTPPPKPIEEITSEIEEGKTKEEAPKPAATETPTETPAETPSESAAPTEEPKPEEEKKPERRRRTEKQQ